MDLVYDGCRNCPIGSDTRRRIMLLGENPEDYQPEYCCCEKTDFKHYMGVCEDAYIIVKQKSSAGKRKNSGRAFRRKCTFKKKNRVINKYKNRPDKKTLEYRNKRKSNIHILSHYRNMPVQ